jgi:hypothetical protein
MTFKDYIEAMSGCNFLHLVSAFFFTPIAAYFTDPASLKYSNGSVPATGSSAFPRSAEDHPVE